MRMEQTLLTTALATTSVVLGAMLMTAEAAPAGSTGNTRSAAASSTPAVAMDLGSGRGTVVLPNNIYDARPSSAGFGRRTYLFSTPGTRTVTHPNPVIHDHRKGGNFGNAGSNQHPPAGTNGGSLPTSGNVVRDHRGVDPYPYAHTVTKTTEYVPGNPNPRTVSSFRTATGMTVTVKSHPKPVCLGNMCWLTEWRPF
jgi:hypothetical protein